MGILQDIYDDNYAPTERMKPLPFSLRLKKRAFYDSVEKTMGEDFIARHWENLCKAEDFKCFSSFREGFRLGVSLMLELL